MELKDMIGAKIKEYEKLLGKINQELATAPQGYIRIAYKHKCPQYYLITDRKDRNGKYLNKSQSKLIEDILQRDYNIKLKVELENQLKHLKKIYASYAPDKITNIYDKIPKARRFQVEPKILSQMQYIEKWNNYHFIPKEIDELATFFVTARGEKVRSKSENIIADTLNHLKIPYRYEAPVRIGGITFHPDFTCLNTRTRQMFIWEHFGLLDNPEYANNTVKKLRVYRQNKYMPGINLITSAETKDNPINSKDAEQIARAYLI